MNYNIIVNLSRLYFRLNTAYIGYVCCGLNRQRFANKLNNNAKLHYFCRGGSRVGVQGVRTPALLIRMPFFEKNLFFQNLLFREDEAKSRTQTFVYVHTDLLTDTCFI